MPSERMIRFANGMGSLKGMDEKKRGMIRMNRFAKDGWMNSFGIWMIGMGSFGTDEKKRG